jgi:biotin carboxyl carrier protein
MKWVVRRDGETSEIEVERRGDLFQVEIDGRQHQVELIPLDGAVASLRVLDSGRSFEIVYEHNGSRDWRVSIGQREFDLSILTPTEAIEAVVAGRDKGPSRITAPIPGKVVAVKVAVGDQVVAGQSLVVLEAMKMENELAADQEGRVAAVHVEGGETVNGGELLVELE